MADLDRPVEVRHLPELLPAQRHCADHRGDPEFRRTAAQEEQWNALLATTDVAIGVPGDSPAGFDELFRCAPRLRWIQATAAGAGEQLAGSSLADQYADRVAVTSAAGIHAEPLAEFSLAGLLAMSKDHDRLRAQGEQRLWAPRWPMRMLGDSHVAVLGLGGIGREVCRLLEAFGTRVTGVARSADTMPPPGAHRVVAVDEIDDVLPTCDALVLTLPGTESTRQLIDARRLALLPAHAVLVNVGRGTVVDTSALVDALDAGRLRGAVLDVTDPEPLPRTSSLWGRDNVILSPHTAALRQDEDMRILDLFADNLLRYVEGRPLRNLVKVSHGY